MKVIIGGSESGKSTILLHYVYNEISKLIENPQMKLENDSCIPYNACFITSRKRMLESKMIFGIYCEVSIEFLKQINLKYIEDYEGLV
jgi:hypothetical protein